MHAVFVELEGSADVPADTAREVISRVAVPMVQQAGGKAGYWLEPVDGQALSLALFATEEEAQKMASQMTVGARPPGAPDFAPVIRRVTVRPVLVSF